MSTTTLTNYLKTVLKNVPKNWLKLTTHRLDIYTERLAKTEFLEAFEQLYHTNDFTTSSLDKLPTAYDYIRLGHPLSCVLEWAVAKLNNLKPEAIISFDSKTIPIFAILRKNALDHKQTVIYHSYDLTPSFDIEVLKRVYNYHFEVKKIDDIDAIPNTSSASAIYISKHDDLSSLDLNPHIDFLISTHSDFGSLLIVNGENNASYVSEIQHVRRRETVAMTPIHSFSILQSLADSTPLDYTKTDHQNHKIAVLNSIKTITHTTTQPLVASSGLSMQYAIMMGLIDTALEQHADKPIKFIVPPNCYGGTNDQARRVAACLPNVAIVDLPVDGDNDMVQSIDNKSQS